MDPSAWVQTGSLVGSLAVILLTALGIVVKLMRTVPTYADLTEQLRGDVDDAQANADLWRRRFARLHAHAMRNGLTIPDSVWGEDPDDAA